MALAPKLPDPIGGTPSPAPAGTSQPAPAPNSGQPAAPAGHAPAGQAPAPKPAAKGTSIYEAIGEPEPGAQGSAAWPENWREQIATATGTPEAGKLLERYQTPADMAKALLAAQQKIRSGEYKRAAPKGDSPEELKAWREEQGIPENPDGYQLPQVQGVDLATLDPATKAGLDVLKGGLHEAGLSQDQAGKVSQSLIKLATIQAEATAEADARNMDAIEDTLRSEWGTDYRRNINMNGALLSQHFGNDMESVLNARMPNGMRLADNPLFNKFLNTMARANGNDVMFDGDVKGGASVDTHPEQIRQVMRSDINKYYAEGLDKEYGQLIEKQQARAGR